MASRGVDLLMFAGGDGTARDIYDAVGNRVPVLGVPTGVKMYSGVFASGPEAAGETAAAFLADPRRRSVHEAEVADADERSIRRGVVSTRLYGTLAVPHETTRMLAAKTPSAAGGGRRVQALAESVALALQPGVLYVVGPGSTTMRVLDQLGLKGTLLGVDAVRDGELVGEDLGEAAVLELLVPDRTHILSGVIGGQGFLFGRGNQQISAEVISRVGASNITVVADEQKLLRLSPPWLRVDTGDPAVDAMLCGYRQVLVAPGRSMVMRTTT